MRRWVTFHRITYWLMAAAAVLAAVLTVWAAGHTPMGPVALSAIVVIGGAAVLFPRTPPVRAWFHHG